MSEIQRYRLNDYQREWGDEYEFEEDASGPIVLYADHLAAIKDKDAEIRLLWTALTDVVSAERIKALSDAVLAARIAKGENRG